VNIVSIIVAATLSENYVLSRLLGIYPVIDNNSNKKSEILWNGIILTMAMLILSSLSYATYTWILERFDVSYLAIIVFALLLFLTSHLVVMAFDKTKARHGRMNIDSIIGNSAVLGVVLVNVPQVDSFVYLISSALAAGVGYTLVSILLSDVNNRIDDTDIPAIFRGFPIQLITLGLMAYAFWGFHGILH
jgi:Na+-translocating ferredoxin:NAD+ oxidoreductase subunit A